MNYSNNLNYLRKKSWPNKKRPYQQAIKSNLDLQNKLVILINFSIKPKP